MESLTIVSSLVCALLSLFIFRAVYILLKIFTTECKLYKDTSLRTILCIGSGGHTTELLRIVQNLNINTFNPRLYILADNDVSSEVKIHKTENMKKTYDVTRIPRCRNVNQSYSSSVISTIYATIHTIPIIYNFKPDVIFCNGPGTCVPICVVAFVLKCLFLLDCRIVFIESICRVRTLSLTGKVLQYFADIIIVQWPQMIDACFRAKYFGRLT